MHHGLSLLTSLILFFLFPFAGHGQDDMKEQNEHKVSVDKNEIDKLWDRFSGADHDPLESDVLIKYQVIRLHGNGCSSNYRFILHDDGRFYFQENVQEDCHLRPNNSSFNKPFDDKPFKVLGEKSLAKIKKAIKKHKLHELKGAYFPPFRVFDGSVQIVQYYSEGKSHVIFNFQQARKEIEPLLRVIWKEVY